MVSIKCGNCDYESSFESFSSNPIFGELDRNMVQCPRCNCALVRVAIKGRVFMEETQPFLVPLSRRPISVGADRSCRRTTNRSGLKNVVRK